MDDEHAPVIRVNDNNCWELPTADVVQSVTLIPSETPIPPEVSIQYESARTQRWCELRMPLDQALFLYSFLHGIREDPRVAAVLSDGA